MIAKSLLAFPILALCVACASRPPLEQPPEVVRTAAAPERDTDAKSIVRTLDALHAAASRADEAAYFACFAEGAAFLGTDPDERWTREEFIAYCRPHFASGKGWTYVPVRRHVDILPSGEAAYFDEVLRHQTYGPCRGSGVLVRCPDGAWRVLQYSLTFLVPNEAAEAATRISRDAMQIRETKRPPAAAEGR